MLGPRRASNQTALATRQATSYGVAAKTLCSKASVSCSGRQRALARRRPTKKLKASSSFCLVNSILKLLSYLDALGGGAQLLLNRAFLDLTETGYAQSRDT